MSLVVHCVTSSGERVKVECGIRVASETNPTARGTGKDLREHAESFGLNVFARFVFIVTDGASVMTAMFNQDRFPGTCIMRRLFIM